MDYLLTFQNTHYAIHSEKILSEKKIPVSVMALPTSLGDFCGICLRVAIQDFLAGQRYLKEAKIPIEGMFKIEENNSGKRYIPWRP
ncbi:hypothetical protein A5821_000219 [Enterococcus sp. 7F3_DIV0205]|uniref:Putative Se/S carrier protein-like domain-containing protein n=1 Tax=Candidatus Enterococcus palustris TaxID=1834189 RepID=A0AAQ3W5G4_9ENTE|nr:DUF3343 domain-containing protein [Enterococcus sp. 7F3_DIV0205]OTN84626.1 hypothetical protein A5821_000554 [Enterococcus sp. 7F3_DIV0205]